MLGWHRTDVNPTLLQYGHELIPNFMVDRDSSSSSSTTCEDTNETNNKGIRVLVPLCGKTVDMAFLAQQPSVTEVVGVDGIRKALDEFASDHPEQGWKNEPHVMDYTTATNENKDGSASLFETIMGTDIRLLKGDFLELDIGLAGGRFEVVLDRASIVAIRPELREAYVATMGRLLSRGGKALIITVDKRQGSNAEAMTKGPPFSVNETEIRRLYETADWVESVTLLGEENLFETQPAERNERFLQDGVTSMFEMVFLIQAKQ
jgi:thiopurine S-methyltransferase